MGREKKFKNMVDHIDVKYVPQNWTGYENPYIQVTVKRGKLKESDEIMLKSCLEEAVFRFGALTGYEFKAEIKQ